MQPVLENYTFLTLGSEMRHSNVYGGFKKAISAGFSNN